MGTTKADIRRWLEAAKTKGATHLVVVCDTFDYEDFPAHVMPGEDPKERAEQERNTGMQRVMEVYALHLDWEAQLRERRSIHYEQA